MTERGVTDIVSGVPLVGVTAATAAHTTLTTTTIAALLPPSTKALWDNDSRIVAEPSWEYSGGVLFTGDVGVSLLVRVRNCTSLGLVASSSLYSTTGRDDQTISVVPGLMAYRMFTTPDERDAATWTTVHPSLSAAGFNVCAPTEDDQYVEIITRHITNVWGGTAGTDNMLTDGEGGTEAGQFWAFSAFCHNTGATFECVEWPQLPLEWVTFSDSNAEARVVAADDETPVTYPEPRAALLSGLDTITTQPWSADGITACWPWRLRNALAAKLNRRAVSVWNAKGGAWQGGEMASDFRAIWTGGTAPIWAGLCGNPSTRYKKRRNSDTGWNDAGDRVTLGGYSPKVWLLTSFINDMLRARLADELGTVTDTFSGSDIKDTVGKRASSTGIVQKILDDFPLTKILAILGPSTDAASSTATWTSTTLTNVWAALTGTDSAYFRFGSGQADSTTGLALRLSDYAATTGLPTDLSYLHFTAEEHSAVLSAIQSTVETWAFTALGVVFVDSVAGSNSNAGTYSAPKQTIAGAGTSWSVLALKRGSVFTETATFAVSGSSGNPKVVTSYGESGARPIISGANGGTPGARNCATITGRSYLDIHGIDFAGGIVGVSMATSASNVRFFDCKAYLNTSHGWQWNCTGSSNLMERCHSFSNGDEGVVVTSSVSLTSRRCTIYENAGNGVAVASTATWLDERSYIYGNTSDDVGVSGGTVTMRSSVIATASVPVFLGAAVQATAGTVTLQNCTIFNSTDSVGAYGVAATGTSLLTMRGCLVSGANRDIGPWIRAGSTGVSGNLVSMTNNAYDDFNGAAASDSKFVVWSGVGQPSAYTFTTWSALTNTSAAAIESGSVYDDLDLNGDPLLDLFGAEPSATSAARSVGVNLTATFAYDLRNKTRPTSGAWTAGAFE